MTDIEIITSINKWNALAVSKDPVDAQTIITLFEDSGNCFSYAIDSYARESSLLHIYPGVYTDPETKKDSLYFFVIPSEYDNAAYENVINKYAIPCKLYFNMQSNRIPDSVAKTRIDRWKETYTSWIPAQCASEVGMFEAFTLQPGDFESEKSIVNLGLYSPKTEILDKADLIVTNIDSSAVVYDDAAGVVPPFGPSAAANTFYLLSI